MNKVLFSFCFVYFVVVTSSQRKRWCREGPIKNANVENITHEYIVNYDPLSNSSGITLLLRVNFDVFLPEGVEIDGFVFHMQHPIVTIRERSMLPRNTCDPGNETYWIKTENATCSNASLICNERFSIPAGYKLCPYNFNTLFEEDRSCWGTDRFVNKHKYLTIPATVRELVFDAEFRTPYFFQVHPYYREYFTMNPTLTDGKQLSPMLDCPKAVSRFLGKSILEATELCCGLEITHNNPRNITFHNFAIDFFADTVNYTVRWLPPITQENISKYFVFPTVGLTKSGFASVRSHPDGVKNYSTHEMSESEKMMLASCDQTTEYYEATLSGLLPDVTYEIQISAQYKGPKNKEYMCNEGHCVNRAKLVIPPINSCNSKFNYCVKLAKCTPQDPTGKSTLNATCTCANGYSGNGISSSKTFLASGCSNIDYCSQKLKPCSSFAHCKDLIDSVGANCSCNSGYFGNGYINGTGCTSISTVALSIVIPGILIIASCLAYLAWRIIKRRARLNDIKWSQFVANDALRTYTIANGLNGDGDELCMPTFGEKWEVDRSKVALGKILGRGNYGVVYQGLYEDVDDEGQLIEVPVAVKMVKEGTDEDVHVSDFLAEIGFMLNIGNHSNVLKVIGCCTTQKPVLLVTDLLKYGDLLHFLWDAREPTICLIDPIYHVTEKSLYQIARQVAEGMDYLTQSRIIHGDLAARNILVGEELVCKISDFGLANDVYRYGVIRGQSERCVPFKWISPERMMAGKSPITSKSDVWSFGNLMYEMVTLGCMPHPGVKSDDLFDLLKSGYRMKQPSTCSNEMFSIMSKCWKWRPSSRPTFAKLVELIDHVLGDIKDKDYVNLIDMVQELDKNDYELEIEETKETQINDDEINFSASIKNGSAPVEIHTNEAFETPT